MAGPISSTLEPAFQILIYDADGRYLCLENLRDLKTARERLPALAALYPGLRLVLRCLKTRTILAQTDGY